MKKIVTIVLAIAMVASLASCKKKEEAEPTPTPAATATAEATTAPTAETTETTDEPTSEPTAEAAEPTTEATEPPVNGGTLNESNTVGVEEKEDTVVVTMPLGTFDENVNVELTEEMKNNGYQSVNKNADGTLTYTITKSGYEKLKANMKNEVVAYLDEVKTSGDFTSIKNVEYTDDFSTVTLTVDKEAFEKSLDVMASRAIYMSVSGYKIFCGESVEEAKVTVKYVDQKTKEEIASTVYPDSLSN